MQHGRHQGFTSRSNLDPKTIRQKPEPEKEFFAIPTLRLIGQEYRWFLSSDTPGDDARMADKAGFQRDHKGHQFTRSESVARRLIAFADYRTKCALSGGFLNPYDPHNPKRRPNDLLPGV